MKIKKFTLTDRNGEYVILFEVNENEKVVQIRAYDVGNFTKPLPYSYCGPGKYTFHRDDYISLEVAREAWRELIGLGYK